MQSEERVRKKERFHVTTLQGFNGFIIFLWAFHLYMSRNTSTNN